MSSIGGSGSSGGGGSFGGNPFSSGGHGNSDSTENDDLTTQAATPHSGRSFRRAIKKQVSGGGNNIGGGSSAHGSSGTGLGLGGSPGHPSEISRFSQGKGGPHISDTVRLDGVSKMYGSLGKLF